MSPLATRPSTTPGGAERGQSLTEFALALPVLLVLVLMALDFGRVYLGYINLQNMARIAANYAANNPNAWGTTPDPTIKTRYATQVQADATATNCALPAASEWQPTFIDSNGDGETSNLGDTVQVRITCSFGLITPIMSAILGNAINVSAESDFLIKSGLSAVAGVASGGGGGGGNMPPSAAFTGNGTVGSMTTTPSLSSASPFAVEFRDTSGGNPTSWLWTFIDTGGVTPTWTSTVQDPLTVSFPCAMATPVCTYNVTLQAQNLYGWSLAHMTVAVTNTIDFTYSPSAPSAGQPVTFNATPTGGSYDWTFGDGHTDSGATGHNTYSAAGPYTVTLTDSSASPPVTVTKTVTVGIAMCTVPKLIDIHFDNAPATWTAAGFTGSVIRGSDSHSSGNFVIDAQNLTATSSVACSSTVTVNRTKN